MPRARRSRPRKVTRRKATRKVTPEELRAAKRRAAKRRAAKRRAAKRFAALFKRGLQEQRPPGGWIPPAVAALMNAIPQVMAWLPPPWRDCVERLPLGSVPYVVCAFVDWRLDNPHLPPKHRRSLVRVRKEMEALVKQLRAQPRPRGPAGAGPIASAVLSEVAADYRSRMQFVGKGEHPTIWRTLASKYGYPNWTELRRQVRGHLRSVPYRPS